MCKLLGDLAQDREFKKKYNVAVKWMGDSKNQEEGKEEEKKNPIVNHVVNVPQWAYKVFPKDKNWALRTDPINNFFNLDSNESW